VRVVAVGTGQAIRLAERGDADVLFVHHKPSEEKFVREGFGLERFAVMYNDYVVVGPKADPAKIGGLEDAAAAFKKIAAAQAPFASRGDNSGTNIAELAIWTMAGIDVKGAGWYRATGSGMGATLNTAAGMGAYALADRGTWISFKNKQDIKIVVEGDPALFNPYGAIAVNPAKHPHVKAKDGQAFIAWLVSAEGQAAIASFKLAGEQLFFPNAKKSGS
jgi:tungstate transport system substrate-binding protein